MDVKKIVLLIGALVIAAVAAITARNMFSGASTPPAQATGVPAAAQNAPEVLVATRSLPVGTIIDGEALRYQAWPQGLVQPAYFVKQEGAADPASLLGTVVRNEISAGQPLTQGALIKPGDRGFLAAALGPGMRAITVSVNSTTSVAGFVFPGDRVDLILNQDVAGGGDGQALKVAETILSNVRVLATDHRTAATNSAGKADVRSVSTVTLEVTPKIAEKIAVAQSIGALSMSLRPIADNMAELERAIASGEISVPEGDPKGERRVLLAVQGKPIDTGSTFSTGGDVSRYQRRSVPAKTGDDANATLAGPGVRVARGTNTTFVPLGAQ